MAILSKSSWMILIFGLLAFGLGPRAFAEANLVRLDPGSAQDPKAQGANAFRNAFRQAYGQELDDPHAESKDPQRPAGAFLVFQRALMTLNSDPEKLKEALRPGEKSFWFSGKKTSEAMQAEGGMDSLLFGLDELPPVRSDGEAPTIYAPSLHTLDRIRELSERVRLAEDYQDEAEVARLDREFLDILAYEVRVLDEAKTGSDAVVGLGVRMTLDGSRPVPLDVSKLRQTLEDQARSLDQGTPEEDSEPDSTPPSLPRLDGAPEGGESRQMSSKALKLYEEATKTMGKTMSRAERTEFEMSLPGFGFELAEPEVREKGVPSYSPYTAHPRDIFFGAASNMRSHVPESR